MKKLLTLLVVVFSSYVSGYSQDTFSICAVDLSTGEVGGAGASCISGGIILSDVHPGIGVIHTQAYWNSTNQNNAKTRMNQGWSPQQIIDWLVANDAQGNPGIRQYGIVSLDSGGLYSAYTGSNCTNWKGHTTGYIYAIQGNILLGQKVLDSMKARFLNTPGNLAFKLMAALQGGKMPGADTRCASYGKSTISAFIRVAKPNDPQSGPYWCDLNVNNTPNSKDPIDSLQVKFNQWLLTSAGNNNSIIPEKFILHQNFPNPFNPFTTIKISVPESITNKVTLKIFDVMGKEVATLIDSKLNPGEYEFYWNAGTFASGVYYYRLEANNFAETKKMLLIK